LQPFEKSGGENPYAVQDDLQEVMQDNVGIMRNETEMKSALEELKKFWERAHRVGVSGTREFNPGWHTALDLKHLFTVFEAIARAALEGKESRGAQLREEYPSKDEALGQVNIILWKASDGAMEVRYDPITLMPPELRQVIGEMK
jgi:succinate dehydrogenase / fumarate reductase, flavoprotein subunit